MALSTYDSLWRGVQLRCPAAPVFLARQWISYAFRQVVERRRWSWLVKPGQFICNAQQTAGTVTVTRGSPNVVGAGTAFDPSWEGRQFRTDTQSPIYTIANVVDGLNLTLDSNWGAATGAGISYRIYNAWLVAPTDFHALITV